MAFRFIKEVSLVSTDETTKNGGPMSEIVLGDKRTGKKVPGVVLEASIRWNDFYLVFTTDGVDFEDFLTILLLDESCEIVDQARLGMMYSTGTFGGARLVGENEVDFQFIGDTTWTVELLEKPGFRIPLVPDRIGVWRPFGFRRHFVVRGDPKPVELAK